MVTLVLIAVLAALLVGASAVSAQGTVPDAPDRPTGTAVFIGGVDLGWNEVPGADSYGVQMYRNGQWTDLPGDGIEIAFYGAGAIISELEPDGSSYWFRVRAGSAHGFSEWSDFNFMAPTNQSKSGRRARPDNVPASGAPVISGTAQVGESLMADTTGIEDGNGLDRVQIRFQWVSHDGSADADIASATDSTYPLVAADAGKTIKVRVAFTDRGGYAESLTGGETATVAARPNSPTTGTPAISGTAQVGEPLTAETSGIADADGLTKVSYSYQWVANDGTADTDITDATDSIYTLAATDEGKTIKVKVSFTDDAGNGVTLTSSATAAVDAASNTPATGAPAINGTAQVGEPLTAETSGIADADGLTKVSYSYQWVANDGTSDTDITGGADSTHTLVSGDEGKTIKVRVSFTDDAGFDETLTSVATEAVGFAVQQQIANSAATGAPTISGTAQVGEPLTAETSGIADADGLTKVSYSYQWVANDGTADMDITDATDSIYTLAATDEGKTIKVKVSFTDDAGLEETRTSAATTAVQAAPAQPVSEGVSYITVAVTEDTSDLNNIVTDLTVTWSDSEDCSSNYNAYLNIHPETRIGHETPGSQIQLGSVASESTQITKGLTGVQGPVDGFDVEVFCGTDGSGRLVSRVELPWSDGRPQPGTYSSEPPLSALSVSHGTLTPAFKSSTSVYTVPDVANADTRITIAATPKEGYAVDLFEMSGGAVLAVVVNTPWHPITGLSPGCRRDYSDRNGPLIELTDADPDTPGFQVDLYDGENHVFFHVYPTAYCDHGTGYDLAITRAEGNVSLVRPNRPAVGLPDIAHNGRPCVGCTVDADVSLTRDRDGMDNATFSYQWLVDDADITGATGSRYRVTFAEMGKTLKVRVSFIDDRGNEESLTSVATQEVRLPNSAPYGKPVVLGTLEVGQTLTADVSGIRDANGLTNATFRYWWNGFSGPNGEEYTLVNRDEGPCDCRLIVTYIDDDGYREQVESEPIGVVVAPRANSPATSAPIITGTAQVGETLTADTTGIADADGLNYVSFSYQWIRNDGSTDTDITSATGSSYTLVDTDEGKSIKVRVSFTDDAGNAESLTGAAWEMSVSRSCGIVDWTNFDVRGCDIEDSVDFTFNLQNAVNDDDPSTVDYVLRMDMFHENGTDANECEGTNMGTDIEVTTVEDEVVIGGGSLGNAGCEPGVYTMRFTAREGASATWYSMDSNDLWLRWPNEAAMGKPTIAGTAQVGEKLTADSSSIVDDNGLSGVTFSYQWIRNDGSSDTDITSGTDSTYTLVVADEGNTIKIRVSFTDDDEYTESLTSTATDIVSYATQQQTSNYPATGAPTISGTAQVGEKLTANTTGIADDDGLDNATYSYQWLGDDTDIAGATSSTYTLLAGDEGQTIKVRVTVTDDAENETTLTSAATDAVEAPQPPAKPTGLSATPSHDRVVLTWDDPNDGTITGYVILRRDREIHPVGTFVTITGDTGSADTTYTDATVEPDKQYVYRIKAINEHGEVSEESDWVRGFTPAVPVPDKPTGLSAAVSHDTVTLTWDNPQDDSITGYVILRRDREIHRVGIFVTITGDTGSTDTTYTDDTVEPDKEYVYRIKAINEHGEVSEESDWVRGFTPAAPAPAGSPAN